MTVQKNILVVGDSGPGTCYSHDSPIAVTGTISDSPIPANINGIQIAANGSTVDLSCGHTGTMIASSSITNNSIKLCRQDDLWTNGSGTTDGTIDTSSQSVYSIE